MLKSKTLIFLLLFFTPFVAWAQSNGPLTDFAVFVSKKYRLPDEMKYNCEWMYAVVKVKTNMSNKVVAYEFVNEPPSAMKKSFNLLLGYQFPKTMNINRHAIVFYLSVDNAEICKPKEDEQKSYAPNDVLTAISGYLTKTLQADPHTIIVPNLIIQRFPKSQQ